MSSESSDYIVYVDESGDHGLASIDPQYPIFVLSFCVFNKQAYAHEVVPDLMNLKFKHFGHDMAILHEHAIRKKTGYFSQLNKELRETFLEELTEVISEADFSLIAVVVDKKQLKKQQETPSHPYHLAMALGLESLYSLLSTFGQKSPLTHVIFEARGKPEDRELQEEFIRVRSGDNQFKRPLPFEMIIVDKKTNSAGLQLADMTARPIGLSQLRPSQPNRAFETLEKKIYRGPSGIIEGYGLRGFPQKAKNPKVSSEV